MQMQSTFTKVVMLKGSISEGNVMPPLTDSYNDICSVSFAGFH